MRHHDKDANAQLAHKELLAHHTSSTSTQIAARDIQSHFMTVKLGDGRFRGSATDFITHLQQQFLVHKKLTRTTLPDEQKLLQMSRAVATVPELCNVKNTTDILSTASRSHVQCTGCFALLQSAATQCNDGLKHKQKRVIYSHEIDPYDGYCKVHNRDLEHSDGETCNIDTPISVIEDNLHERAR